MRPWLGGRVGASGDRGDVGGSGGDGAGLAAGDGRPVGGGADTVAGGGSPRRGGPGGAQGPGVVVARCARRVGGGDRGGDWPVRCVRGPRPGDGLAGRRGLLGWSAPFAGLAAAGCGWRRQHQSPLTRLAVRRNPRQGHRPTGHGWAFSWRIEVFVVSTHDQDGVTRRARAQQVALFRLSVDLSRAGGWPVDQGAGPGGAGDRRRCPSRPVRWAAPLLPRLCGSLDPSVPRWRVRCADPVAAPARHPHRHRGAGAGGGTEAGEPRPDRRAGHPDPAGRGRLFALGVHAAAAVSPPRVDGPRRWRRCGVRPVRGRDTECAVGG